MQFLKEQIPKFKAYRSSNRDQDRYRTGLFRHKVEQAKSDIRWLERLIAQEQEVIRKRERQVDQKAEARCSERRRESQSSVKRLRDPRSGVRKEASRNG